MDKELLMEIIDKSDIRLNIIGHGHHPANFTITKTIACFALIYTLSGSYTLILNNRQYKVLPGETYLAAPGTELTLIAHEKSENLHCHFSILYSNKIALTGEIKENRMIHRRAALMQLFRRYMYDLTGMRVASQNTLKSVLKIVFYEMVLFNESNIDTFINSASKIFSNRIYFITEYIKSNISQPLKISSLAEVAGYTPSYFSRYFKQVTGIPVSDYISNMKMDAAKQLLSDRITSVNEVASKLGFTDQFIFSRKFKKHFGISPKQYAGSRF